MMTMIDVMNGPTSICIIYDGDCILCRHFRSFVQLRRRVDIVRYDMNKCPDRVKYYCSLGYDIDQGMIIDIDGVIYHGTMALTILDTLVAVPYWRQRVLLSHIRRPWIAKMIYPVLLLIRKIFKGVY